MKSDPTAPGPAHVLGAEGIHTDSLGFLSIDSNVPGLSQVILKKLNMKDYEDYRSALEGKKGAKDFGIRTYHDMFQKMEDTFKFCAECRKLPDALQDSRGLRRCKRCQNVYYCSLECQRGNWPAHKKFCKKLKFAAIDRLMEWLVFTGDLPFRTDQWSKPISEVKGWNDWFSLQEDLDEKIKSVMSCRYMNILWSNAGKPRPEEGELQESVRRVTTDFLSRPLCIGYGLHCFNLDPYAGPVTVHVVGASYTETLNARVTDYDELARMFPGNQGLEVVMIGPEVVDGAIMRPPLASHGPRGRVYLSSFKGLYHVFWETLVETQQAVRPDLVVGFHPVYHRQRSLLMLWSIMAMLL
uniref:MSS51 mitochondrial translational activator n=1 Tax=Latimeria chalumnae TaxID=7897 RepID=H3A2V8_LATCH